jgi:hypothetical protein
MFARRGREVNSSTTDIGRSAVPSRLTFNHRQAAAAAPVIAHCFGRVISTQTKNVKAPAREAEAFILLFKETTTHVLTDRSARAQPP